MSIADPITGFGDASGCTDTPTMSLHKDAPAYPVQPVAQANGACSKVPLSLILDEPVTP